jgi:hypothetical protein
MYADEHGGVMTCAPVACKSLGTAGLPPASHGGAAGRAFRARLNLVAQASSLQIVKRQAGLPAQRLTAIQADQMGIHRLFVQCLANCQRQLSASVVEKVKN